jgi:hypothetical protein
LQSKSVPKTVEKLQPVLGFALGLAQANDPVAFLPLTALLQEVNAFESF